MPELNPITRQRYWYIVAFLAMDAAVALGLEQFGYISTASPYAFWLFVLGIASALSAACLGAVLYMLAEQPVDLKAARQRE
jgi:hypothetical protein